MNIDQTTLQDLSFFKGEFNLFSLINHCTSQMGAAILKQHVINPPTSLESLISYQNAVKFWIVPSHHWPSIITNGTLVMIENFFESPDTIHGRPNNLNILLDGFFQKIFNKSEYSFVRFSISHIIDFLKGFNELIALLEQSTPPLIEQELRAGQQFLQMDLCQDVLNTDKDASQKQLIMLSYRIRREAKNPIRSLMKSYARLDALHSMAVASTANKWALPELLPSTALKFQAKNLFHPLLKKPTAYDIDFSKESNFLFLTGANMSGKSTFIRALGIAAILSHLGMGVPAQALQISFLEGIISNIQVEDDIIKGESYFFAEVNRMKVAAEKLSLKRYHLVLMDELFKGTNVHDAYECTQAVIEGLLHHKDNLMALSTHLYELAHKMQTDARLNFRYFYTEMLANDSYRFTYQLKPGVSNDRIGFLVMKKEGVLDLLTKSAYKDG